MFMHAAHSIIAQSCLPDHCTFPLNSPHFVTYVEGGDIAHLNQTKGNIELDFAWVYVRIVKFIFNVNCHDTIG